MVNRFFTNPENSQRMYEGPLGPYMDAYAALLYTRGYSQQSARTQIRLVADLSRWLHRQGLDARDVDPQQLACYLKYRRKRVRPLRGDASAFCKLRELLHAQGITGAEASSTVLNESQRVEENFKHYLSEERALARATVVNYVPFAQQFLLERFGTGRLRFSELKAQDITGFVQRHAHTMSPGRARLMVTGLRAFFRYLQYRGDLRTNMAACVPPVANWSLATVPKYLAPDQVERVLRYCDRQTPLGRRNYAILLLLARLGLRAGEVVALKLDDIDWETGQITLRGKGGRCTRLPLPQAVGQAIAAYLQNGRPVCSTRALFIREKAPRVGLANSIAISTLVARALQRAGIHSPRTGAHLFRHSLATQMLRQGASLAEIGELLRHQSPQTTAIYAKVDLPSLRTLALAWPGGGR